MQALEGPRLLLAQMCLSVYVRRSHFGIVSKRIKLASLLSFCKYPVHPKLEGGHLEQGRFMRRGGYELTLFDLSVVVGYLRNGA